MNACASVAATGVGDGTVYIRADAFYTDVVNSGVRVKFILVIGVVWERWLGGGGRDWEMGDGGSLLNVKRIDRFWDVGTVFGSVGVETRQNFWCFLRNLKLKIDKAMGNYPI